MNAARGVTLVGAYAGNLTKPGQPLVVRSLMGVGPAGRPRGLRLVGPTPDESSSSLLDERDQALDVFHHPFAHAAARGIEFSTGRPELLLEAA